jgi:hypothetical protein
MIGVDEKIVQLTLHLVGDFWDRKLKVAWLMLVFNQAKFTKD